MSTTRNLAYALGRVVDRSGILALCQRIFTGIYTLYKAKDLGSFGRGSSIQPFSIFQGQANIHVGSGTHIWAGCLIQAERSYHWAKTTPAQTDSGDPLLRIGDGTLVGRFCHITARERIEIGERVLMGERILIADHDHGFKDTSRAPRDQPLAAARPVTIGDACWIGDGAAILAGASLGTHVVVGANAVVRGEVPPFTVVAGNPARPVRRYDADLEKWLDLKPGSPV